MSPELERLIGQAMTDVDFRHELLRNPADAAQKAGLDKDETAQLEAGVKSVLAKNSAQDIDSSISGSAAAYWG